MNFSLISFNSFPIPFLRSSKSLSCPSISLPPHLSTPSRCAPICFSTSNNQSSDSYVELGGNGNKTLPEPQLEENLNMQVGNQILAPFIQSSNQAFFLLSFVACTTCVAFTSLVIATIPTLNAMRRAAISLSKLADAARGELPSTMASIRLSGMEISDLTLELSDLSQEISDGVKKSAQAVQAAEAGVRQIGALAHQRTIRKPSLPTTFLLQAMVQESHSAYHLTAACGCRRCKEDFERCWSSHKDIDEYDFERGVKIGE